MRPVQATPAHRTDLLAELVCSNSFKSVEVTNAHGLLKAELRLLGSLLLRCADVPAPGEPQDERTGCLQRQGEADRGPQHLRRGAGRKHRGRPPRSLLRFEAHSRARHRIV